MLFKKSILFFSMISILMSCSTQKANVVKEHTSRNSLSWDGLYRGMLPCNDCEGIQTEIILFKNNTYEMAKRYEGKSTEISIEKGSFRWSAEGNKITFYSANNTTEYANYLVGENQLIKLANNGDKINDEYAGMYVFKKKGFDDRITEKYWQLIELNGKAVEPTKNIQQLNFMLKLKDSRVYGFGGCNRFAGHFELLDGNRILFTKMLNTLIACKNAEQEQAFLKVFELIDHYTIKNDTLSLAKARMPSMAKFKAIYMR